jgi:flavin-dependent dehydrogenase
MNLSYDVVVIGGGPAGSTVGTLVAQKGRKTLVIERSKFPRFHIGESLMPETYWVFRRLGMLSKLKESPFTKKYSVQFVNSVGKESQPFYFDEMNPHDCSQTWQVLRSEFDELMLHNAAEHGADVWQEANVTDVHFEPSENDDLPRATGVTASRGGQTFKIDAKVIVDATGNNALISRKLKIRNGDPKLRKAAIFAHYQGAIRDAGKNAGATLVVALPNQEGWFWYIPLADDIMSVGVVADPAYLIQGRENPQQTLDEEIAKTSWMANRLKPAKQVSEIHVASDYTYQSRRVAGDGWVLVGDAFAFLDPIYSSGVFLALKTGELAADAIIAAFKNNDFSALSLSNWGDELIDGYNSIRKIVYAYYTKGFSFGKFIRRCPQYQKNVTDLLIGDVFRPEVKDVFGPMSEDVPFPELATIDHPPAMASIGKSG